MKRTVDYIKKSTKPQETAMVGFRITKVKKIRLEKKLKRDGIKLQNLGAAMVDRYLEEKCDTH